MGETGCVSWMFEYKGVIEAKKEALQIGEEELLELVLEAGAEDLQQEDDLYLIITNLENFETVRKFVTEKLPVERSELTYLPENTIQVTGENLQSVLKLIEALEEHDDVQNVYSNLEIDDTDLEALA